MTVAAHAAYRAGSVDLGVSFSSPDPGIGTLDFSSTVQNLAILTFGPFDTTTYWYESRTLSSTTAPTYFTMTSVSGTTGAPFTLTVATRLFAAPSNAPTDGMSMSTAPGNQWNLYSYGRDTDYFTIPSGVGIPRSQGTLVTRYRVASNLAADQSINIPFPLDPFTSHITDQSWTGYLHLYVWISAKGTSTNPFFDFYINEAGLKPSIYLPTDVLTVPNRDTGRSGNARANSAYGRDPISGFTSLRESWVQDGFRRGTRVDPLSYDPPEPPKRPQRPEKPSI